MIRASFLFASRGSSCYDNFIITAELHKDISSHSNTRVSLTLIFLISVVLTCFSVVLQWAIPSDAGLGVFAFIVTRMLVVGILGVLFICVVLWRYVSLRTIRIGMMLILGWVFAPVLLGPMFAAQSSTMLFSYYDSDQFLGPYRQQIGLEIERTGQVVEYAHCRLESFTGRYTITAKSDTEVIFTLENRNGISYNQFDRSILTTLSSQFQFSRDEFVRRGINQTLGVFSIPLGTHTIELRSRSPFVLGVYDTNALTTPQLVLLGERDYAQLYVDDYTQEELAASTIDIQNQSCPSKESHDLKDPYFLNQFLYIPNAVINLNKGSDHELYLYNQWPGNSGLDESLLLSVSTDRPTLVQSPIEKNLYRTVTNNYSQQKLNVSLIIERKDDPYRPPYLPPVNVDEFIKELPDKSSFSDDELLYLNRTDSYFYVEPALVFDSVHISFQSPISAYNVQKVIEIIENIKPSQIQRKELNL